MPFPGRRTSSGWDEGVLLNTEGLVAKCSASNIFIVRQERLFTPHVDRDLLPGIVRAEVLALARRLGLDASEAALGVDLFVRCRGNLSY
ncbi:aminotransferase class IV [Desulforudis sp. DRI-14]|uniref:aminotransferase class IV n=1 Tax=Desulforudis sp. DRI-14 TaxID=3459793 RepID=UPI004042DF09